MAKVLEPPKDVGRPATRTVPPSSRGVPGASVSRVAERIEPGSSGRSAEAPGARAIRPPLRIGPGTEPETVPKGPSAGRAPAKIQPGGSDRGVGSDGRRVRPPTLRRTPERIGPPTEPAGTQPRLQPEVSRRVRVPPIRLVPKAIGPGFEDLTWRWGTPDPELAALLGEETLPEEAIGPDPGVPQSQGRPRLASASNGGPGAPPEPPSGPEQMVQLQGPKGGEPFSIEDFTPGINNCHIGEFEIDGTNRFGRLDSIFASLTSLGVRFIRQPGYYDLLMPPDLRDAPLPADLEAALRATIMSRITLLLNRALKNDISVVLTLFTLGGVNTGVETGDAHDEMDNRSVAKMGWGKGTHVGQTIVSEVDPSRTATWGDTATGANGKPGWDDSTFDVRDEYKLIYLQNFAFYVGRILCDVATDLVTAMGITDKRHFDGALLGIEIFNEINVACRSTSDTSAGRQWSASLWANAVGYAVEGLHAAYQKYGGGVAMPNLWWPSLASENVKDPLSNVREFHSYLVQAVDARLPRGIVPDATSFTNQDAHWYRFRVSRETAMILTEVDVVNALQSNFSSAGLSPTVSICESGASMTQLATDAVYPSYVGVTADKPDASDAEYFQAAEVIRRLATAAASGARYGGWHSHMGKLDGEFYGTGLRDDESTVTAASDALQRKSYFVYQRWISLVGKRQGQVFWPVEADYHTALSKSVATDGVVILQFPGTTLSPYVYLLFFDSAYEGTSDVAVELLLAPGYRVTWVSLYPSSTMVLLSGKAWEFPGGGASFSSSCTHHSSKATSISTRFQQDFMPLLAYSNKPIAFTVRP